MKSKLKLIDVVVIMTMLTTLLYVVANRLPSGVGSFRFAWGPFLFLLILFLKPNIIIKKPFKQVVITLSILMLLHLTVWNNIAEGHKTRFFYEDFLNLAIFSIVWSYYFQTKSLFRLHYIAKISLLFILITLITTNIALTIDPLIVRNSVAGFLGNVHQIRLNKLFGSAGYGYAQGFVILIPVLVYHIKNNIKLIFGKKMLMVFLGLVIITILRSNVFANILTMVAILALSLAGIKRKEKMFKLVAFFVILYILIPNSFYIDLFESSADFFPPESETYYKLNDFARFLENPELDGGTSAGGRAARYPLLFEAFARNPLLGDASYDSNLEISLGFHLYWMYKLTVWGLLGFSLFIYMLYSIYKTISNSISDPEMNFYYFLSALTLIILGSIKNIAGREPWLILIVVIPGLFLGSKYELEHKIKTISQRKNNVQK